MQSNTHITATSQNIQDFKSTPLKSNIKYHPQNTYPATHWAYDWKVDKTTIASVEYHGKTIGIYVNPMDCRGYRMIIKLVGDENLPVSSTLNRPYTTKEDRALSIVTDLGKVLYRSLGIPIVQEFEAANNSHSFDKTTNTILFGNPKEPNQKHKHLVARGVPGFEYIPGVPLLGPVPGENFDMMGKTPTVAGNEKKMPWESVKLQKTIAAFKEALKKYQNETEFKTEFSELKINMEEELNARLVNDTTTVITANSLFSHAKNTKAEIRGVLATSTQAIFYTGELDELCWAFPSKSGGQNISGKFIVDGKEVTLLTENAKTLRHVLKNDPDGALILMMKEKRSNM